MSKKLERHQAGPIQADLKSKMVLLSGPRQCGKTTLATDLLAKWPSSAYYSWDVDAHRRILRTSELDASARLWVFDELHKFRHWRNWLKGQYDLHHSRHAFLVTGSARLDIYSRGGDSMQGRYFMHRLHPITLCELSGRACAQDLDDVLRRVDGLEDAHRREGLTSLMMLGGFPEPLFSGTERHARKWRLSYGNTLVREDIRTLENLRELDKLELLYERLPAIVGSVLSINALREDLEVAFETVRNWLTIFDYTYAAFRVPPFGPPRLKAVKKEQKLYLWDWARVEGEAARFENLVALHLLRFVHWAADVQGEKLELRYFRNVVGHEVDFVLLREGKPWLAVEAKISEQGLDPGLKYLLERVKFPHAFQIHLNGARDLELPPFPGGCRPRLMSAARFLAALP